MEAMVQSSACRTRKLLRSRKENMTRRDSDGSLILPLGGLGGDVIIYADESKETLLEFHQKRWYCGKRGGNVDAMGSLTSQMHDGFASPALPIPVPVGMVVKRKRGRFLADLARPGDEILVARGGQGGISLLEMPEHKRKKLMALSSNLMRDETDKGAAVAYVADLLAVPAIFAKAVTDIVDGEKPTAEEFLQNLVAVTTALDLAVTQLVDFISGKCLSEL